MFEVGDRVELIGQADSAGTVVKVWHDGTIDVEFDGEAEGLICEHDAEELQVLS